MSARIKKARGIGRPGHIHLQCLSTNAVDGQEVSLQGSYAADGENRKGLALGLGVGVGIFLWPALFCMFIKGEKVEIPVDVFIPNVVVNDEYSITVKN